MECAARARVGPAAGLACGRRGSAGRGPARRRRLFVAHLEFEDASPRARDDVDGRVLARAAAVDVVPHRRRAEIPVLRGDGDARRSAPQPRRRGGGSGAPGWRWAGPG